MSDIKTVVHILRLMLNKLGRLIPSWFDIRPFEIHVSTKKGSKMHEPGMQEVIKVSAHRHHEDGHL